MKKLKDFSKKYLIGFILGVISAGAVIVYAETYFPSNDVTYDNKESGLTATNVQGAIDELYGVCTTKPAGDQIIENAGLEKDPYECRYFFTGANPNNYITFNEESWRIISVECDGTIKIMKTTSIGSYQWDTSNSNNWARPASLNTYLNATYYNRLNATSQSQIVAKDWGVGVISGGSLVNQIEDGNRTKWNGKVALVTVSEYIRSNSNKNSCGSYVLIYNNYLTCKNTTWMNIPDISGWWTLSPFAGYSNHAYHVNVNGRPSSEYVTGGAEIYPTLYLSSEIKITGGTGTQSNPYEIEL